MKLPQPIRRIVQNLRYRGDQRYCPVCEQSSSQFLKHGYIPREDARCPQCGTLERHRLLILFLRQKTNLFDGQPKKMLHIAPELALRKLFSKAAGSGYLTADLFQPGVDEKMDITDIRHPENSFDVIYCSHVLEHVPDDQKAMREFYRVLKPGGWAILNVPITADTTFEDPSITDPQERLRLFGQDDHVRRYGPDYIDRLRAAGFEVACYSKQDFLSPTEIERCGLKDEGAGEIYYCTKS